MASYAIACALYKRYTDKENTVFYSHSRAACGNVGWQERCFVNIIQTPSRLLELYDSPWHKTLKERASSDIKYFLFELAWPSI